MKRETKQNKLNALLGIVEKVEDYKAKSTGNIVGISEDEIQEFREIQGLIYFLQAPTLFDAKKCPHCGEFFIVSRKYVAYCSYTCIKKSLEEVGINWTKDQDLEALAVDPQVYGGNEPIWVRRSKLEHALKVLQKLLNDSETQDTVSVSAPSNTIQRPRVDSIPQEPVSHSDLLKTEKTSSVPTTKLPSSPTVSPTNPKPSTTIGKPSSKKRGRRVVGQLKPL